jgi:predicted amino acid-binding ACT domain protein
MKNIVERKTVIDIVHYMKHRPIFIEAEQMRQGEQSKPLIDEMIKNSDALIIIDDDHLGRSEKWLRDMTPLQYEIREFQKRVVKMGWDPRNRIVAFVRKNFRGQPISEAVYSYMCTLVDGAENTESYKEYDDLAESVRKIIKNRWGIGTLEINKSKYIKIQYSGQDKPGILGTIAELLYTQFRMNVTHVSGTAVGDQAFIVVIAVPWIGISYEPDKDKIRIALNDTLKENVDVSIGFGCGFEAKFYFELRVLDVPGVLNALCKALAALHINISDLRQRPAPREFDRQSIILMWLTPTNAERDIEDCYLRVEARLRNLVGVLAISSHIIAI